MYNKISSGHKALEEMRKELGDQYTITTIDGEEVLYRDFGNGYNVEISGVQRRAKYPVNIYLWYLDTYPSCRTIKSTFFVKKDAKEIHRVCEEFYHASLEDIRTDKSIRFPLYDYFYGPQPKYTSDSLKQFNLKNSTCVALTTDIHQRPVTINKCHKHDAYLALESPCSEYIFRTYDEALAFCRDKFPGEIIR